MAIRYVQALLAPSVAQMDPDYREKLGEVTPWTTRQSEWGTYTFARKDDELFLQSVRTNTERHDFRIGKSGMIKTLEGMSDKFWDVLFGRGIDIFADIPLAHTCIMTGYEKGVIDFENTINRWELSEIPIHSPQSYLLRKKRKGAEAVAYAYADKTAIALLREAIKAGYEDFEEYYQKSSIKEVILTLDGPEIFTLSMNLDPDVRQTYFRGKPFTLMVSENGTGYLALNNTIPESVLQTSVGKKLSSLIGWDLLEDFKITHAKNDGVAFIDFQDEDPSLHRISDAIPELQEVIERLKKKEKEVLPIEMARWDEMIAQMDEGRQAKPENHYLTAHLFRKGEDGAGRGYLP